MNHSIPVMNQYQKQTKLDQSQVLIDFFRADDYIAVQAVWLQNLLRNSISLETKISLLEKDLADTVKKFKTLRARLDDYEAQKAYEVKPAYVLDLRI